MAEKKKHKKRKQHLKNKPAAATAVQAEEQEQDPKAAKRAQREQAKEAKRAASEAAKKAKAKEKAKGSKGKAARPGLWTRFVTYLKNVKIELQRVVWPTPPELLNASLIVIGAIVFFGVLIAIVDNIVIIPLDWISTLGA